MPLSFYVSGVKDIRCHKDIRPVEAREKLSDWSHCFFFK